MVIWLITCLIILNTNFDSSAKSIVRSLSYGSTTEEGEYHTVKLVYPLIPKIMAPILFVLHFCHPSNLS